MALRDEITAFLDDYLDVAHIRDYGTNGLQVIGKDEVSKVALGVSASLELFQKAAAAGADMLVVHHGLFWSNTPREVGPMLKQRLKTLFDADVTLLAYHLPLDAHPEVGNNIQLLNRLNLTLETRDFGLLEGTYVGVIGTTTQPVPFQSFVEAAAIKLATTPQDLAYGPPMVRRVGILSGGGAAEVREAIERGCDVYVTGEVRESTLAVVKESGINYVALGHYNSERYGVMALGELLRQRFGVVAEFIDVPNPY